MAGVELPDPAQHVELVGALAHRVRLPRVGDELDLHPGFLPGGIHMTTAGHEAFARRVAAFLKD